MLRSGVVQSFRACQILLRRLAGAILQFANERLASWILRRARREILRS